MRIVAERDSHIGLLQSVLVGSYTGRESHVHEFSGAIALVKIVGLAVVGHKKIELAIVIEVRPNRGQAIAALGVVDSRFLRHIGKSSVAVVVVKIDREIPSVRAGRTAHRGRDTCKICWSRIPADRRDENRHSVTRKDRPSRRHRSRQKPRPVAHPESLASPLSLVTSVNVPSPLLR